MANIKLLQEAIQAFANGETAVADKKMRKYFVEQAQEINKKLEEEMDSEEDLSEAEEVEDCEEVIEEDIHTGQSEDLTGEIQYALGEADDEEVEAGEEEIGVEGDDDAVEDFGADAEVEVDAGELPSEDQWASIKDVINDLGKMFSEIEGSGEVELDAEGEDFGAEEEIEDFDAEGGEEFGDVSFGEEKVGEAYKMKNVAKPSNDAAKSKSPVASNAKSPVDGVSPVKIKDGTVTVVDDSFDGKDVEHAKVDDMNNVMDNAKGLMKDVKKPTNKAEKSKSPLPSKAPKF